ncbi:MAG: hypothetical protein ACOYLX_12080, partial [Burkholderiaceae bacterium]
IRDGCPGFAGRSPSRSARPDSMSRRTPARLAAAEPNLVRQERALDKRSDNAQRVIDETEAWMSTHAAWVLKPGG